jgi:hypothetical protein
MATAELSHARGALRLLRALRCAWPRAYAAVWLSTLCSALLVALLGAGLERHVRTLLGLGLQPAANASPSLARVVALAAHNFPIAAWPVLLGVLGAHQHRLGRQVADVAVLGSLLANTAPVGAAFASYGVALLAYVPQLPLEWAGLALGASAWLVQRRRPLVPAEGLLLTAMTATVLVCAAAVETMAVPHQ